jgi:hypothetical protein
MRLAPLPSLVDWTLLGLVATLVGTGLLTALAGEAAQSWVFTIHSLAAVFLVAFLGWKLRRVVGRLRPANWERGTWTSALTGALALLALATGVAWTWGAPIWFAGLSWLAVHAAVGLGLGLALLVHLRYRYRPLRPEALTGRRTAIRYVLIGGLGVLVWRLQEAAVEALWTARRFTGSRERGSFAGTAMPVTMWAADDPDPIDADQWSLTVDGAVETPLELRYDDLTAATERRATLDCTSGWYSRQDWRGVPIESLLAAAEADPSARWVRIESVTGYRWSLPLDEAREALLATTVSGDRLDHGHGFPARLVAPGRRGFQWVKWVDHIEVRRHPDFGQWLAIFTSGFDGDQEIGQS